MFHDSDPPRSPDSRYSIGILRLFGMILDLFRSGFRQDVITPQTTVWRRSVIASRSEVIMYMFNFLNTGCWTVHALVSDY